MIDIRIANEKDAQIIALLGRITYSESHGKFIENKNDLIQYNNKAFSIEKITDEINDESNILYRLC